MVTSQQPIIVTTRMLVVKQRSNVTGNDAVVVLSQHMVVYYVLHILQLTILGTFPFPHAKNKNFKASPHRTSSGKVP